MNQINKQDNSNFHQIKQNFRKTVVACVEITLKNSQRKQKKLESDAQTMRVPITLEIISTVTNLQTSTLKNHNHKKIGSI